MRKFYVTSAALAAIVTAGPAAAHHSTAMFDTTKSIELHGTVVEFQYTNPHSWLIIEIEDENGEKKKFGFEGEAVPTMMRAGIGKSSIPEGEEVTVIGHPLRDGRDGGQWMTVELPDGKILKLN